MFAYSAVRIKNMEEQNKSLGNENLNLKILQAKIKEDNISCYIIFPTDSHLYSICHPSLLEERKLYCPFDLDEGILLVTQTKCYLFTKKEYFDTAEKQLQFSDCELCKDATYSVDDVVKFIKSNNLGTCAFDYNCISTYDFNKNFGRERKIITVDKSYKTLFNLTSNIKYFPIYNIYGVYTYKYELSDVIENTKPDGTHVDFYTQKCQKDQINLINEQIDEKIERICQFIEKNDGDGLLLTSLDDIAYVLNCRGDDLKNDCVFYAYLYIDKSRTYKLFLNNVNHPLRLIDVLPYDQFEVFIKDVARGPDSLHYYQKHHHYNGILLDEKCVNKHITDLISFGYKNVENPVTKMKMIKDDIEIFNMKRVHEMDDYNLFRYLYQWNKLDNSVGVFNRKNSCESDEAFSVRLSRSVFYDNWVHQATRNFVVAYKENSAEFAYNYQTNQNIFKKGQISVKNPGLLLISDGGYYFGGTTAFSRAFYVGDNPPEDIIEDYTLTLKALINLMDTVFMDGCNGLSLDIKAREVFWRNGLNYKFETGHDIGYMMNFDENVIMFDYRLECCKKNNINLVPGMTLHFAPGIYRKDKYGIRLGLDVLVVPYKETSDGKIYTFEPLSYFPFERNLIDKSMLTEQEINYINNYHRKFKQKMYKYFWHSELALKLLEKSALPL